MTLQTYVRVQNQRGDQYDVPKGAYLRPGVKALADYPEHRGHSARPPKPRVSKGGSKSTGDKSTTNTAGDTGTKE